MTSAPTIGAIPTTYKDVKFRSRLEARWAVFFDALAIEWEYEAEAYSDGVHTYLPDFWLPELDCFVEIKPDNKYDLEKVEIVSKLTGKWLYVATETPWANEEFGPWFDVFYEEGWWDGDYRLCGCPSCHRWGFEYGAYGGRMACCQGTYEKDESERRRQQIQLASIKAKTYRFWDPKPRLEVVGGKVIQR